MRSDWSLIPRDKKYGHAWKQTIHDQDQNMRTQERQVTDSRQWGDIINPPASLRGRSEHVHTGKASHSMMKKTELAHRKQDRHREREIFDDLRPVNREGSHQGETKCVPTTSENCDNNTHPTVQGWRTLGEMKLNELGRQKVV